MGRKTKVIKLARDNTGYVGNTPYRVIQVTDSLEFDPGQYLTKKAVDDLCRSPSWKVTVVAGS